MQKSNAVLSFQGIRTLAFLAIFASHCGLLKTGPWGVEVFVLLSGFLMVYNYENLDKIANNPIVFSVKKISKLYPLHIVMMLMALVFEVHLLLEEYSIDAVFKLLKSVLTNVFLVQAWIPDKDVYWSLNGVSWYLSVCLVLYAVFPFILRTLKNKRKQTVIAMLCICITIQTVLAISVQFIPIPIELFVRWFVYINPIYRCLDFFIGCCLGYLFIKIRVCNKYVLRGLEIFSCFYIVFSIFAYSENLIPFEGLTYSIIYLLGIITLIITARMENGLINRLLGSKLFVFVGDRSAYCFLIHQVMISYVQTIPRIIWGKELGNLLTFIIALCLTMIAAIVWNILMKRFMRKKL